MTFKVPEKFRLKKGRLGSDETYGNNGAFVIRSAKLKYALTCIASDENWEHVSVSRGETPTWDEMAFIKDLFWDEEDFVIQMPPPAEDYVNNHPHCLHLWRKAGTNDFCERPPSILVGVQGIELNQGKTT